MPRPVNFRVPLRHRGALIQLAGLDQTNTEKAARIIEGMPDPMSLDEAAAALRKVGGLEDTVDLVASLISLEDVRSTQDWALADVAEAAAKSPELDLPEEKQAGFAALLVRLLDGTAMSRAAKAASLRGAHPRSLYSSRVITDLRPVFDEEAIDRPTGAVILHQLELVVYTPQGYDDLFIGLDDTDLRKLRSDIDRALEKSRQLQRLVVGTGVPIHQPMGEQWR
jgi:hypothetical protein